MRGNSSWPWFLTGRVFIHAVLGGLFCALVGALLISVSGGLIGLILDFETSYTQLEIAPVGAAIGAMFGAISGGIIGAMALALAGLLSPPNRVYWPPRLILLRTASGMTITTIGMVSSFLILSAAVSTARNLPFTTSVGDGISFIVYAVPALMVFGLAVGTYSGVRHEWNALKRQETEPSPGHTPAQVD